MPEEPVLSIQGVSKRFGGVRAVQDVSFEVRPGEIAGLIGPNGAGKSTLFELIAGTIRPDSGVIRFQGRDITGMPSHLISRGGVGRTFQKMRLFMRMTALDNVMVSSLIRHPHLADGRRRAMECLEFVGLAEKAGALAKTLSTGQRKRLELARAMACEPTLLLLDEVTAGVDPGNQEQLVKLLQRLNEQGTTLVMVEHNLPLVHKLVRRLVVMHLGQKIAEGLPAEVLRQEAVARAYVGDFRA